MFRWEEREGAKGWEVRRERDGGGKGEVDCEGFEGFRVEREEGSWVEEISGS